MTSQQLGDLALEEHRAVMAALIRNEISRPTQEQYDETLFRLSECMSCPEITCSPSFSLSQGASQ
jgi:hypothetical protein